MEKQSHLPIGYRLQEYQIDRVLGQGGFGITYLATDVNLDKQIVIKEFFPKEFSSRESNVYSIVSHKGDENELYRYLMKKFLSEAKILASFSHPNIITVTRFFEENSTAYFIMDYVKGESLKSYIERNGSLSQDNIEKIIIPILEGLKAVHKKNFLHRDIAPDNIYLTIDGRPILIDFGSAKDTIGDESKSLATIVKAGYSAPEQYISSSIHTKSTDIYAIGGVIASMISGDTPPEATKRQLELYNGMPDPLKSLLNQHKSRYSKSFLEAVLKSMSIKESERFQEVGEFQYALVMGDDAPSIEDKIKLLETNETTKFEKKNKGFLFILPLVLLVVTGLIYSMFFSTKKEKKITIEVKDINSTKILSDMNKTVVVREDTNSTKPLSDINKTVVVREDINSTESLSDINKIVVVKEDINGTELLSDINKTVVVKEDINGTKPLSDMNKTVVKKESKNTLSVTYNFALMYDYGAGVKEDKPKAIKLYEEVCNFSHSLACKRLGEMYEKGEGVKKDINKTIKLYKKSCNLNNALACNNLAYIYRSGTETKKDIYKAIKIYQKSCDLNNSLACKNIGEMYEKGKEVKEDINRAIEVYTKSCNLGNSTICKNLGFLYIKGEKVEKNITKSINFYNKSCDLNNSLSCANLGILYDYGEGVKKDKNKAVEFYKKGCELNNGVACANLGYMYDEGEGIVKDDKKAVELYLKACSLKDAQSCASLGSMYEKGEGTKKSKIKSKKSYQKACNLGYKDACSILK